MLVKSSPSQQNVVVEAWTYLSPWASILPLSYPATLLLHINKADPLPLIVDHCNAGEFCGSPNLTEITEFSLEVTFTNLNHTPDANCTVNVQTALPRPFVMQLVQTSHDCVRQYSTSYFKMPRLYELNRCLGQVLISYIAYNALDTPLLRLSLLPKAEVKFNVTVTGR